MKTTFLIRESITINYALGSNYIGYMKARGTNRSIS